MAIGALLFAWFGYEAICDARVFTSYRETTCTIVGVKRPPSDVVYGGWHRRQRIQPFAVFTFAYRVAESQFTMRGDSSSALAWLSSPSLVPGDSPLGAMFPCWYDPGRPDRVVLLRRVSPLYVTIFIPVWLIWRSCRLRRRS